MFIDHNLQIALKIVRISGNATITFKSTWCTVITGHKTKVIVTKIHPQKNNKERFLLKASDINLYES